MKNAYKLHIDGPVDLCAMAA
jgi:hypothetical protein